MLMLEGLRKKYRMVSTIKHICVICKDLFTGFGHNPDPISTKGRCCDNCNNIVILTRLKQLN